MDIFGKKRGNKKSGSCQQPTKQMVVGWDCEGETQTQPTRPHRTRTARDERRKERDCTNQHDPPEERGGRRGQRATEQSGTGSEARERRRLPRRGRERKEPANGTHRASPAPEVAGGERARASMVACA